jgi:hypothetical protein
MMKILQKSIEVIKNAVKENKITEEELMILIIK